MKEKLAWGLFVVVAACAVAAAIGYWLKRPGPPRVPDFKVIERSGEPLTRRDLMGQVWVADFIFTRCSGACPVMMSRMWTLQKRIPEAMYVSFTVDPRHDTPDVLAKYAQMVGCPKDRWLFATGTHEQMQTLAREGFLLAAQEGRGPKDEILHSQRFVLVDRYGRLRGWYDATEEGAVGVMEGELRKLLAERALPIRSLPALNAGLNGTSALLLLVGLFLIKSKRIGPHKACMLGALSVSSLFLVSYLTAHYYLGSTPYPGQGWTRPLYFSILLTHTILAAFIVPLAGITLFQAFRNQFDRHRAIARWTFPLWLYVSVTGVVIYFMLY